MMHDHGSSSTFSADLITAIPFVLALVLYGSGVVIQRRRARPWPWYRSVAWTAGIVAASAGFIGPLAAAAHDDFVAHMWAHLLVGMAAPLLLVLAAPVTLALRTLQVRQARRLSWALRSRPARVVTTPVVAALLNLGGMWMLYATPLYEAMQQDPLLHLAVMAHFLVAGCLLTAAIIPIDPAPHRAGYPLRMAVVVVALAAHGILARTLYAHPPAGVDIADAQAGSMLMYYWGDLIDVAIITVLCAQWYRQAGRKLGAPTVALGR